MVCILSLGGRGKSLLSLKNKGVKEVKGSWYKGDIMLEKHPSITCHLKPNLLLGNQVHCLDFGDSSIETSRLMSALKENMSKESRAAGKHE